jgi:lysophospholipid acyltransferase (LPLAT)-like uncharacterized protein
LRDDLKGASRPSDEAPSNEIADNDQSDSTHKPEPERKTRFARRVKKLIKRGLVWFAVFTLPRIYLAYMWLVYKTSTVEELGFRPDIMRQQCGQGVYAIWHDQVFLVAYAFGKYKPHTLASRGDFGELIARLLQLCHFTTFRGGSSSSKKRRSAEILEDMIDCMNREVGVLYGITTDGSKGPAYRMKKGAAKISVACQAVIGVQRTWCKRYIQLPTWDQTFIPLPFNRIVHVYQGPFYPPQEADGARAFVTFTQEIETALCHISGFARRKLEGSLPDKWVERFPKKYQPAVKDESLPELLRPIDSAFHKGKSQSATGNPKSSPESMDAESP